jgi:hypothetical protein
MKEYIREKTQNITRHFKFGNIDIEEIEETPDGVNLQAIFKALENNFPSHYFQKLKSVKIQHIPEFDDRNVNALYRDNSFTISSRQDSTKDLMDDIVHEFAHHMETIFPELIYSDQALIHEFRKKRQELKFEIQTEGYWVDKYDFDNLKFDEKFDIFLYKRVGTNMLRMITTGLFIRPYAAVSLREYFATGFEAYYLGKQETLEKISPMLYDKITELHTHSDF